MDGDEWTVERHLAGRSAEIRRLYDRYIELVSACGPFTYAVARTAITLKGTRRGFTGVAPAAKWLDGYFDLMRQGGGPRIRLSSPYTKRLFVHQFRVVSPDQLDDEFAGWLAEAYAVGQGAHLNRPA